MATKLDLVNRAVGSAGYPFPRNAPQEWYAPWWRVFLAWAFGYRIRERSGPWEVRAYWWRGKLYVTKLGRWR